jgi:type II secretory pathway pseudopilin PulG
MIELILVMTIMTIIGLFAAMAISNIHDGAKRKETEATIHLIEVALDAHRHDKGAYPVGDHTVMVNRLTMPTLGWSRAGMENWFPERSTVVDGWGMPFSYIEKSEYGGRLTAPGIPIAVERTPKKGDYYNPMTYQIYSTGPNMKTWPPEGTNDQGHNYDPRLCGTEEDDIRNWKQDGFWTPADYQ